MKVIVIGGGPAGMIAAINASKNGDTVTLLEKMRSVGRKLSITGKGRCNVTNNVQPTEFLENVISNPKFLYGSIFSFTPQDTMEFFESQNIHLKTERGNRVFPVSDKASDITKALTNFCQNKGVKFEFEQKVIDIKREKEKFIIVTNKQKIILINNLLTDK